MKSAEIKLMQKSEIISHKGAKSSGNAAIFWGLHKKVHVCMCVCVQKPHADRLLRFSIKNASKWPNYPAVVYRGAVPAFYHCCHLTGRWLPALKAEKHGLSKEPLMGAVFESVAQHIQLQTRYVCTDLEGSCNYCVWLA